MARVIFDFDGTIADSMWLVIDIYEELFRVSVSPEQVEHIRGLNAAGVLKHLGVPMWKAPKFLTKGKKMMRSRMKEVRPFDGIAELLIELQKDGHTMGIMSSNSEANVHIFLKDYKLDSYFSSVVGGLGLFGKAPVLRQARKNTTDKIVYIGDESRDLDAAKKAHVPIIAVGWGYNNGLLLKSMQPDYFAETPEDIKRVVEAL